MGQVARLVMARPKFTKRHRKTPNENKNFVFDAAVAEKLLLFDAHEGVASENQSIESLWSLLLS